MKCSITQLLDKAVINIKSAEKIGALTDVEIDTQSASICSIIVAVKCENASFFSKYEKVRIDWSNIKMIGKDAILIDWPGVYEPIKEDKGFLDKFLN